MSPIDNHLRESLSRHAAEAPAESDWFTTIERRAQTMRRRRMAWISGATSVVLAGGVIGGLAVAGGDRDTVKVPIGNGNSETPSPSATPSGFPGDLSNDMPPPANGYLDWPYREGPGVAAAELAYLDERSLWGGRVGDAIVVIGQKVDDAGVVRANAWISENRETYQIAGARMKPERTNEVSFVLPGEAYPWVLVIGAPTTGQIEYAADGSTYEPVETVEGWALFKRTGNEDDRIRVLDGDGDLDRPLYEGPIDTGPSEPDV